MIDITLDSTQVSFIRYLNSLGLSPKSHKNYRSDLNHFVAWAILKIRSFGSYVENLSEAIPFLNPSFASEYKNYMAQNGFPEKTINRRLSTLRHLSRFLVSSQIIDSDFMEKIENISLASKQRSQVDPVIQEFRGYLENEKVSPNTIKNYLSDIRQFLTWLESNQPTNQSTN